MATCSNPAMEAECESKMKPNWLELPADITSNILQRLGTTEIVTSACHVCPLWWKICKDPLMWRTIHITNPSNTSYSHEELEKICCFAVKRSSGRLEDIDIEYFATDDLLECIAENANIRCLRLTSCQNISNKAFSEFVRKLPQIEEIDISHCNLSNDSVEVIGRSCPLLKSFKFASLFQFFECAGDEFAFVIAETMQGLQHLDIGGSLLTNNGLLAILDSCPLLESLQLGHCFKLDFTGNLRKRCLEQIKSVGLPNPFEYFSLHDNDFDDFDFDFEFLC